MRNCEEYQLIYIDKSAIRKYSHEYLSIVVLLIKLFYLFAKSVTYIKN